MNDYIIARPVVMWSTVCVILIPLLYKRMFSIDYYFGDRVSLITYRAWAGPGARLDEIVQPLSGV